MQILCEHKTKIYGIICLKAIQLKLLYTSLFAIYGRIIFRNGVKRRFSVLLDTNSNITNRYHSLLIRV